MIMDEVVCNDISLTAYEKLSTGLVYEHSGPDMTSSRDATGIGINEGVIGSFTALEFIGNTDMTNAQLDTICKNRAQSGMDQLV
jgi:hypothetical protein